MEGKGMPKIDSDERGKLIIKFITKLPDKLTDKQKSSIIKYF